MNRFIVLHNPGTEQQDNAFAAWIESKGWGWWHWLAGSWLLVGPTDLRTEEVRDGANQAYPGVYKLVMRLTGNPPDWAAFGLIGPPHPNMFAWLDTTWVDGSSPPETLTNQMLRLHPKKD
jgi:hypothetical protein